MIRKSLPLFLFLFFLGRPSADLPYGFRAELDLPMTAGFFAMKKHSAALLAETRSDHRSLEGIERDDIPPFDRWAIGFYSPKISALSSVVAGAGLLLPVAANAWGTYHGHQAWQEILVDVFLLQQALMLTSALSGYAKSVPMHATPLVYDDDVPVSEKMKPHNASSFFSNHTTSAFTTAVYSAYTFQLRHPGSPLVPWAWGGSLALAAGTGTMRILAGKHFPTDVIAGAAVGAFCGYVVPRLHLRRSRNSIRARSDRPDSAPEPKKVSWDLGMAFPSGADTPMPVVQLHF